MNPRVVAFGVASATLLSTLSAGAEPPSPLAPYAQPVTLEPPVLGYKNSRMRVTGIVLTGIASTQLVVGTALLIAAARPSACADCSGPTSGPTQTVFDVTGVALVATSALLAIAGVPLWVVGAAPAPESVTRTLPPPSVRRAETRSDPHFSGLHWTF